MNRVLITGSNGTIGRALAEKLGPSYDIIPYDLPEHDATNFRQLERCLKSSNALIHLAFDLRSENSQTGCAGNPENLLMGHVALAAAAKVGVETCIMGSSVHAARSTGHNNQSYRTTKLALEAAATMQAERYPSTSFVSIRFGYVSPDDRSPEPPLRVNQTWLSHQDAAGLVRAVMDAPPDPTHQVVYGVSNRTDGLPYDTSNQYGWAPQDWFGQPAMEA